MTVLATIIIAGEGFLVKFLKRGTYAEQGGTYAEYL